MYNFQIGKTYSFNTLAPSVLGTTLSNQYLKGIVDYTTANTIINVELMHRTIYPLLPTGSVNNPQTYTWLLLRSDNGTTTAIAVEWIDQSTVQEAEKVRLVANIPVADVSDAMKLRDTLTLLGYKNFTIDVEKLTT